jgi:hypothetical protein
VVHTSDNTDRHLSVALICEVVKGGEWLFSECASCRSVGAGGVQFAGPGGLREAAAWKHGELALETADGQSVTRNAGMNPRCY